MWDLYEGNSHGKSYSPVLEQLKIVKSIQYAVNKILPITFGIMCFTTLFLQTVKSYKNFRYGNSRKYKRIYHTNLLRKAGFY